MNIRFINVHMLTTSKLVGKQFHRFGCIFVWYNTPLHRFNIVFQEFHSKQTFYSTHWSKLIKNKSLESVHITAEKKKISEHAFIKINSPHPDTLQ